MIVRRATLEDLENLLYYFMNIANFMVHLPTLALSRKVP